MTRENENSSSECITGGERQERLAELIVESVPRSAEGEDLLRLAVFITEAAVRVRTGRALQPSE